MRRKGARGEVAAIAESLRADIVSGRLRAGGAIPVAEVSETLDVTMADVRQALLRLTDLRLVNALPEAGFAVATASADEFAELTALRKLVEGEAVRLSVSGGDDAWRSGVRAAHEALTEAERAVAEPALAVDWQVSHAAFHEILCAAPGSPRLVGLVRALRDEAEIYREIGGSDPDVARRAEVEREHRELMELAIAGRAEEAASLLRAHLDGTMRHFLRVTTGTG